MTIEYYDTKPDPDPFKPNWGIALAILFCLVFWAFIAGAF